MKPEDKKINLFLDSGAYSAFTQNTTIDIQEYISFIKRYEKYIDVYANLDSIGDPAQTLKNQRIMEEAGLSPLPCFHYGSPISYLKRYLKKYNYIALGGMVPISTVELIKWLDLLFSEYLCDEKGNPKCKVHGFGLTSLKLMLRYPWYSVDSTSWVVTGRLGSVLVPKFRSGKYEYLIDPWKVSISNRSPNQKDAGQHLSTFSPFEQKIIHEYLDSKGFKVGHSEFRTESEKYKLKDGEKWNGKAKDGKREVETIIEFGLCNDYKQRDELNIIYYLDLEKAIPPWPQPFKTKRLRQGLDL